MGARFRIPCFLGCDNHAVYVITPVGSEFQIDGRRCKFPVANVAEIPFVNVEEYLIACRKSGDQNATKHFPHNQLPPQKVINMRFARPIISS